MQNHEPKEVSADDDGTDVYNFNHIGYNPREQYEEREVLSYVIIIKNERPLTRSLKQELVY